jgi:hypothetical protein
MSASDSDVIAALHTVSAALAGSGYFHRSAQLHAIRRRCCLAADALAKLLQEAQDVDAVRTAKVVFESAMQDVRAVLPADLADSLPLLKN